MTGTFFFCGNCHPLMRDDAFLLHVLCLPLSPAQACIGEVPSSASCIGRPSSALHIRLFRLKLSHKKRDDIDADKFFLSRQKRRTSEIWAFYGVLPLFSFPFPGCRSSPSFFSFLPSFLLSPFFRMPSFMRGAFSFFLLPLKKRKKVDASLSLCPSFLRNGKKKLLSREEKKASRTIFLRRSSFSFFVFSLIFAFLFVFSPVFSLVDLLKKGIPSSLLRSSSAFLFLEKRKREKKGMPQTREDSAFRNGKGKEEETDALGIRFLPPGRQNFACDSDFRKRRDKFIVLGGKLPRRQI